MVRSSASWTLCCCSTNSFISCVSCQRHFMISSSSARASSAKMRLSSRSIVISSWPSCALSSRISRFAFSTARRWSSARAASSARFRVGAAPSPTGPWSLSKASRLISPNASPTAFGAGLGAFAFLTEEKDVADFATLYPAFDRGVRGAVLSRRAAALAGLAGAEGPLGVRSLAGAVVVSDFPTGLARGKLVGLPPLGRVPPAFSTLGGRRATAAAALLGEVTAGDGGCAGACSRDCPR
mmetsp:Transcript_42778/g.103085  ORF Transcript_42778/g.103085 Transcript_42778/m.103085 type:complete len:239 (+) Transcript_42778:430-1146(+)